MNILNERLTLRAGGLALLAALLWGGNTVTIKVALAGIPPFALAAIRFLIGGVTVLLWAALSRVPLRMEPGERRGLSSLALLFAAQILLLNQGIHFTVASRAVILMSSYPVFVAVFAHVFIPGDKMSRARTAGMLLSLSSVIVLLAEGLALGERDHLVGDVMILTSALLLGARQVYMKRIAQRTHPYRLLLWQTALSLPVFFLMAIALEKASAYRLDPWIIGAILYQGVLVAGVCFIIWVSLLRRYSASRLGVFAFFTPVFGVGLSSLLLGEPITVALLGGTVLVAAGVAIVNLESRESSPDPAEGQR